MKSRFSMWLALNSQLSRKWEHVHFLIFWQSKRLVKYTIYAVVVWFIAQQAFAFFYINPQYFQRLVSTSQFHFNLIFLIFSNRCKLENSQNLLVHCVTSPLNYYQIFKMLLNISFFLGLLCYFKCANLIQLWVSKCSRIIVVSQVFLIKKDFKELTHLHHKMEID